MRRLRSSPLHRTTHTEKHDPGPRKAVSPAREIVVHPNYIVIYRVRPADIEIVNVIHTRQQYP
ncbi:type II toxin-antitoxin system RelE/ParE family toxin [Burkholderia gladioli]|uniref:type II toxin-antitoxin system RelE/ParE family toxin n=1 Tax=Burkholderia gladioli TaxID=28095 RepID=UPI001641D9B9|nr:type II toxin-antitoxin system RelE/ParE family toxin [Burkholderia gladioli]